MVLFLPATSWHYYICYRYVGSVARFFTVDGGNYVEEQLVVWERIIYNELVYDYHKQRMAFSVRCFLLHAYDKVRLTKSDARH